MEVVDVGLSLVQADTFIASSPADQNANVRSRVILPAEIMFAPCPSDAGLHVYLPVGCACTALDSRVSLASPSSYISVIRIGTFTFQTRYSMNGVTPGLL